MTDKGIEAAAIAVNETFIARTEEISGMSFDETGVCIPSSHVLERYARAAISAYFANAEPVAFVSVGTVSLMKECTPGASKRMVANKAFGGFTVPLFAAPEEEV